MQNLESEASKLKSTELLGPFLTKKLSDYLMTMIIRYYWGVIKSLLENSNGVLIFHENIS